MTISDVLIADRKNLPDPLCPDGALPNDLPPDAAEAMAWVDKLDLREHVRVVNV